MAKINLVIALRDEVYLKKLCNYILSKSTLFNPSSYTSKERLLEYVYSESRENIDILLLDELILDDRMIQELPQIHKLEHVSLAAIPVIAVLCGSGDAAYPSLKCVSKFGRTDKLLNELLLMYSESTGKSIQVGGNTARKVKVIGVYSPVGGSGKTSIALGIAAALAEQGKRSFYLNFEKISGTSVYFTNDRTECLSDVLLSLKNKNANTGLKIQLCKISDAAARVEYFNPPESAWEYNELTDSELQKLLEAFRMTDDTEFLLIDMSSEYSNYNITIMQGCDLIINPVTTEQYALRKLRSFYDEVQLHHTLSFPNEKLVPVINKMAASSRHDMIAYVEEAVGRHVNHVIYDIEGHSNMTSLPEMASVMKNAIFPTPVKDSFMEGVV